MDCGCNSHGSFLTAKGLEEAAQRSSLEGLLPLGVDSKDESQYLDKVGSVSALVEVEGSNVFDHELIDSQYRRFLNGS